MKASLRFEGSGFVEAADSSADPCLDRSPLQVVNPKPKYKGWNKQQY